VCGGAIGTGQTLVDETWLLGNAAKPLAAIADDGGCDVDAGIKCLIFAGLKIHVWPRRPRSVPSPVRSPAIQASRSRCAARRRRACNAVALDHGLHQLVLNPHAALVEIPSRRPNSMLDRPFLPWASRCIARNHTLIGSLVPWRMVPAISNI
jgi:hypothetical protein